MTRQRVHGPQYLCMSENDNTALLRSRNVCILLFVAVWAYDYTRRRKDVNPRPYRLCYYTVAS